MNLGKRSFWIVISISTILVLIVSLSILVNFIDYTTFKEKYSITNDSQIDAVRVKMISLYISECIILITICIYMNLCINKYNLNKVILFVLIIMVGYLLSTSIISGISRFGLIDYLAIVLRTLLCLSIVWVLYILLKNIKIKGGLGFERSTNK